MGAQSAQRRAIWRGFLYLNVSERGSATLGNIPMGSRQVLVNGIGLFCVRAGSQEHGPKNGNRFSEKLMLQQRL
jgi:hypothetical protein